MQPIVIFGTGQIAEIAHFYLTHDSKYDVVAFTVDGNYISNNVFCNLPVVAFEEIETFYPSQNFQMFVALSYAKVNQLRTEKYNAAKSKGYSLISYISSKATTWSDTSIGENCFILEDNTIQPFVEIGNNVTLWSGNHIGHHTKIEDNCFISSHVVISGGVEVGKNCFIGVNTTIRDHIKIGEKCVIGAGTLLLSDAEPEGVYMGTATERSKIPSRRLRGI